MEYPRTYSQSSFFAGMWHGMQSVLKSVATFRFGSFASNNAQPHPSPHRSFLGNRPFESLTITNQILMSLVQVDCPVVSFSEPTVVTSFTRMAPSGNLPSRNRSPGILVRGRSCGRAGFLEQPHGRTFLPRVSGA